jgi:hypothetical protein
MTPEASDAVTDSVRRFAGAYWERKESTFFANRFLGVPVLQNPFDAWVTQEIIVETRPEIVVETGTMAGGSALLWAWILEQVTDDGRVVTIDSLEGVDIARRLPLFQRRVEFIHGNSTAPAVIEEVTRRARGQTDTGDPRLIAHEGTCSGRDRVVRAVGDARELSDRAGHVRERPPARAGRRTGSIRGGGRLPRP